MVLPRAIPLMDIVTLMETQLFLSILAGECPAPTRADFPLGTIQGADYSFKASIAFECRDGYELIGMSTLTCTKHGRWNGFFPVCEGTV